MSFNVIRKLPSCQVVAQQRTYKPGNYAALAKNYQGLSQNRILSCQAVIRAEAGIQQSYAG